VKSLSDCASETIHSIYGGIKMKKSLLVVVSLLCMASLMAAMAYTTAKVTSSADMIVTKSSMALLRFDNYGTPEEGYTSGVSSESGEMWFDFTQGTTKNGFQPNSEYTYSKLFRVINEQNRNNDRNSSILVTAETDLPYLYLYDSKGTALIENGVSTGNSGVAGYYTVVFKVPSGAPMNWQPIGSNITFSSVTVDAAE
jgi:hypothetical protein